MSTEDLDARLRRLEEQLRRLEDREQIKELVARYGFVVDDRDIEGLTACFTEDALGLYRVGEDPPHGRAQAIDRYHELFAVIGPTNHFTHNHVIWFDERDPDLAFGLVNSHAEMLRGGRAMLCAMRYDDEYRRGGDGRWRFIGRKASFVYYLEPKDYGTLLRERVRVMAYDEPRQADLPEGIDSYRRYYEQHPSPVVGSTP